ncbi:hypothetical protein [Rhodanobacter thiooxydans]|nr:hypothetical protein [Rhodanobacter thiooxydans]MCW0202656.1 hypothetical protein [Rhodanobacter thiooxydans]
MDTNENIRSNAQDDVIELSVASVETKGVLPIGNEFMGHAATPGITE